MSLPKITCLDCGAEWHPTYEMHYYGLRKLMLNSFTKKDEIKMSSAHCDIHGNWDGNFYTGCPYCITPENRLVHSQLMIKADEIINGERATYYGKVSDNFGRIAAMWSAYLKGKEDISVKDVANMMILLKISRAAHSETVDNDIDIIGYVGCKEKYDNEKLF